MDRYGRFAAPAVRAPKSKRRERKGSRVVAWCAPDLFDVITQNVRTKGATGFGGLQSSLIQIRIVSGRRSFVGNKSDTRPILRARSIPGSNDTNRSCASDLLRS